MNTTHGVASANGVKLHYECFGDANNPAVLLVCGMAVQSVYWPDEMCRAISDAGYYLVRFDNRDSGPSTYTAEAPKRVLRNILRSRIGRRNKILADASYDLDDLVVDAIGILDHLGIPAAHWVGFSMGGMISQLAAADHPERVLSLCSIMSSTNESDLPVPDWRAMKSLFPRGKPEMKSEERIEELITGALDAMSGTTHTVPAERKLAYARASMKRGMNPDGPAHHLMAMMATGGFSYRLSKIAVPTLVIHGSADPLVRTAGGIRSADKIPGAQLEILEGMGHEFPPSLYRPIVVSILRNISTAEADTEESGLSAECGPDEPASNEPRSSRTAYVATLATREAPDVEVLIVGAGFAGMAMAIKLKELSLGSFLILERAEEIGGTWRDNTYPGCACDVQSHLYSYSFAPKADWSRKYAGYAEIQEYLRDCGRKFQLHPHIRFGTAWQGAQYDEKAALWRVKTSDGNTISARALVLAVGALSNANIPDIPGRNEFVGESFHSAKWNHDYDFSNKKVAVIGTGASAIQIVPEIAKSVASLQLFQRTPAWVLPKENRKFGVLEIEALKKSSMLRSAYRNRVYWRSELRFHAFRDPNSWMNRYAQRMGREHIQKHIKDPAVREALTPDYPVGCKRALLSDNYYSTLAQDHVELVTSGIAKITEKEIVDNSGQSHAADAIVFATGFRAQEALGGPPLRGLDGQCLQSYWRENEYRSYLGIATHGFPNLFTMTGPNTGLGHNSIVYMIEVQANYIASALGLLGRGAVRSLEVLPEIQNAYCDEIQEKLRGTAWSSGCNSWYQTESGKNFAIWPDHTFRYKQRCETFEISDYDVKTV